MHPGHTDDPTRIRQALAGFGALAVVAMAAGASRMWPPPLLLSRFGDVLRWREALSMLVYAPLLVLLLWRLYLVAAAGRVDGWALVFVAGAYFLGAGMAMHDTCDRLGSAYPNVAADIRGSLDFFDSQLGHWVFFAGFVLTSVAAGAQQVRHPLQTRMTPTQTAGFLAIGLPLLFVMLTNLVFEKTGADLCVIAVAVLTVATQHALRPCHWRRLPILCVLYPSYGGAVAGTLLYWALRCR